MGNYLTVKLLHNFFHLPLTSSTCYDHQAGFSWDDLPPLGVYPSVPTKASNTQKILRWELSYRITFQVRDVRDQVTTTGVLFTPDRQAD